MKTVTLGEYICKVGQNAQENWNLLDKASQKHWFFHLSSFPSCYVIWENEDDTPDMSSLKEVARICVNNTKHRNARNIKVDYTRCNNVCKGKIVGEVHYSSRRKVIALKV